VEVGNLAQVIEFSKKWLSELHFIICPSSCR